MSARSPEKREFQGGWIGRKRSATGCILTFLHQLKMKLNKIHKKKVSHEKHEKYITNNARRKKYSDAVRSVQCLTVKISRGERISYSMVFTHNQFSFLIHFLNLLHPLTAKNSFLFEGYILKLLSTCFLELTSHFVS
jgi:hypothetical protein